MAYDGPDEWFGSKDGTVEAGMGGGREPIAQSLTATNRAAFSVWELVKSLPAKIAELTLTGTWFEFKNQDDVPVEKRGKDNVIGSLNATNGRVFHPQYGLKSLSERLDAIEAKLDKLAGPGN
jgi:hypothetical protein